MKARLIKLKNNELLLLCTDGSIFAPGRAELGRLLSSFQVADEIRQFGANKIKDVWNGEYPDMSLYPGTTLAYVTDSYELVISDFSPFKILFEANTLDAFNMITAQEYADMYGKSVEQIKVFCRKGRLSGAVKIGRDWLIPSDAPYPADNRVKSGRYLRKQ
ncbi:MAG: hypothetical protein IJZ42_13465 [Lachnospiraceae bacterium]|nr:hypothetical protein [Lachnospiraceae bacterium]